MQYIPLAPQPSVRADVVVFRVESRNSDCQSTEDLSSESVPGGFCEGKVTSHLSTSMCRVVKCMSRIGRWRLTAGDKRQVQFFPVSRCARVSFDDECMHHRACLARQMFRGTYGWLPWGWGLSRALPWSFTQDSTADGID